MMPLFDMIANAQNGKSMELLARQFNLNAQQTQLAVEALLPAFSEGLKRKSADPMNLGALMQAMLSGQHAQYFENTANAFSPKATMDGNDVLGQLFGSKDVSRAVAANAQAMTGIGQEVLKQMLPVIASMLMGGLFKQTAGQMQSTSGMGGSNPFGQLIEQMMRQTGGMGGGSPSPAPSPMDNPFGQILEQMMGGAPGKAAPGGQNRADERAASGNPWIDMLEQMAKGAAAPTPEPRTSSAEPRPANPMEDMFGQMFETGRTVQKDYEQNVKSIFDQYLRNMDRLR
jgi:hypothetical protein